MDAAKYKREARIRRHRRVRKKVRGSAERPRLAVFRSNKNISAQLIDDRTGKTLASASSLESGVVVSGATGNAEAAAAVGKTLGERGAAAGVSKVVFDRGGNAYHGRVKALADAAREAGMEF